jgi:hypothetical protein
MQITIARVSAGWADSKSYQPPRARSFLASRNCSVKRRNVVNDMVARHDEKKGILAILFASNQSGHGGSHCRVPGARLEDQARRAVLTRQLAFAELGVPNASNNDRGRKAKSIAHPFESLAKQAPVTNERKELFGGFIRREGPKAASRAATEHDRDN